MLSFCFARRLLVTDINGNSGGGGGEGGTLGPRVIQVPEKEYRYNPKYKSCVPINEWGFPKTYCKNCHNGEPEFIRNAREAGYVRREHRAKRRVRMKSSVFTPSENAARNQLLYNEGSSESFSPKSCADQSVNILAKGLIRSLSSDKTPTFDEARTHQGSHASGSSILQSTLRPVNSETPVSSAASSMSILSTKDSVVENASTPQVPCIRDMPLLDDECGIVVNNQEVVKCQMDNENKVTFDSESEDNTSTSVLDNAIVGSTDEANLDNATVGSTDGVDEYVGTNPINIVSTNEIKIVDNTNTTSLGSVDFVSPSSSDPMFDSADIVHAMVHEVPLESTISNSKRAVVENVSTTGCERSISAADAATPTLNINSEAVPNTEESVVDDVARLDGRNILPTTQHIVNPMCPSDNECNLRASGTLEPIERVEAKSKIVTCKPNVKTKPSRETESPGNLNYVGSKVDSNKVTETEGISEDHNESGFVSGDYSDINMSEAATNENVLDNIDVVMSEKATNGNVLDAQKQSSKQGDLNLESVETPIEITEENTSECKNPKKPARKYVKMADENKTKVQVGNLVNKQSSKHISQMNGHHGEEGLEEAQVNGLYNADSINGHHTVEEVRVNGTSDVESLSETVPTKTLTSASKRHMRRKHSKLNKQSLKKGGTNDKLVS